MKKSLIVVCAMTMLCHASGNLFSQWLDDPADDPKADNAEKAMKWFYEQRSFGLGYIPQDGWMKALKQQDALRAKYFSGGKSNSIQSSLASQADASWINVGPINIESAGSGLPYHSGRINTIVTHPTDPNIAYLGGANGGIWKTTNAGTSWKPLSDYAYSLAMGALAIDPKNPNILYAGTGEYTQSDNYFGAGMLKSTDAGKTWTPSGLGTVGAFSKVLVNPHNTSIIYAGGAGSGGGLYISNDAGTSWTKTAGTFPPGEVTDIDFAQLNGNDLIYVAVPAHGIYLSQDGGKTWDNIHDFSQPGSPGQMRRVHVAVDPKNARDIIALSITYGGTMEALDRSTDLGNTWSDITNGIGDGGDVFTIPNSANTQGWYDAYLMRDPSNPNNIFVGGISVWNSNDGGSSWTDVGLAYKGGIHPDQHAFAFAKAGSGIVYSGSDGGIAVSTDGGNTFSILQDSVAITQSYTMAIDQTVNDVSYIANQDNGTLTGGRNADWGVIGGGDGGSVIVSSANHDDVYFTIPGNLNVWLQNDGSPSYSDGLVASDSVGWIIPLGQDEVKHIFYLGTQFLYVRANGAGSWTRRTKKLASSSYISAIGAAGDGKTLLIGTTGGRVWSTTDNGVTFTDRTKGLPGRIITSIRVSPADKNTFYITLSGFGASHVMKTTDLGADWTDISSTLPNIPSNSILIDDQHPTNLYIGTDIGVFFSPDDGADWLPYGTGLPHVAVTEIEYHKTNRVIRAATHGRSMWEAPMAVVNSGITTPTISNVWYIGEPAPIGWYGISSADKIEISLDNGSSWSTVTSSASGTNYTIGTVNYAATENALVKVTSGSTVLLSQNFRIRTRPIGSTLSTFSEQPLYMYDLAYDKDDNVLWVTNFNSGDNKIYKMNPDNGQMINPPITVTGGTNGFTARDFTGIKYDPLTKHLFVHESNQSTNSSFVAEVDLTGKVIRNFPSLSTYGTGIFVSGDSLFLADRNNNVIHVINKKDPSQNYGDLDLDRHAPFGPRCITLDPATGNLLHTWTDFQGTDANATLYDSYILRLNRADASELGSWFVQDGVNSGTNVRGLELDPRASGTVVWVTVLNSGNSSKILKIQLAAAPPKPLSVTLVSPPNGSQKLDTSITFSWAQAIDAVTYEFQLSEKSDFSSFITDSSNITGTSVTINNLHYQTTYYWRIKASGSGTNVGPWSDTWNFAVKQMAGVSDIGSTTDFFIKNYPNPFSGKTTIEYCLDTQAPFSLKIYDLLGREIRTIATGWAQTGGHSINFDAESLAGGVYNVILESGGKTTSHLIHLVK